MTTPQRFADDAEGWEPRSGQEWLRDDPLIDPVDADSDYGRRVAEQRVSQLRALPMELRRQAWREREIMRAVMDLRPELGHLGRPAWVGVGRRGNDGERRLTAILSIDSSDPLGPYELERSDLVPRSLQVDSRVPEVGREPVRVVIEPSRAPVALGVVPPDMFVLSSDGSQANQIATVQSGDGVASENWIGVRTPGTLTAIVSRSGTNQPMLLGAGHVFRESGATLIGYVPDSVKIGKVVEVDYGLDAGLAEFVAPWQCDFRVRGLNAVPAAPSLPVSDMPVQFFGASSGYQSGRVDQAYRVPVGAGRIGLALPFSVHAEGRPGDSGALIVAGQGRRYSTPGVTSPVTASSQLSCAMLGMLVAGTPASRIGAPAEVWAIPIVETLERFGLHPWFREDQ